MDASWEIGEGGAGQRWLSTLIATLLLSAGLPSCSDNRTLEAGLGYPPETVAPEGLGAPPAEPELLASGWQEHVAKWVAPGMVRRFERRAGRLHIGDWLEKPRRQRVRATFPERADEPVRIVDTRTSVAVSFTLKGAPAVPVATRDGFAVYNGAGPEGSDLLQRPAPSGVEDFVFFPREPERKRLRYVVDVSAVAGVRLFLNTLEFLDDAGVPRLRVTPPYVISAEGRRHVAELSVEGCSFDTAAQLPWRHAVVRPGAASCEVVVAWPESGVRYPALVDPTWESTADMQQARRAHTMTLVEPPSTFLIAGGFNAAGGALSSVELYYAGPGVFSPGGSLATPRGEHVAAAVSFSSPLRRSVVVSGGRSAAGATLVGGAQSVEVYDFAAKTFVTAGVMDIPRVRHTMTTLPPAGPMVSNATNRVLVAGGLSPAAATADARILQVNNTGLQQVNVAFSNAGALAMAEGRSGHAAVLLDSGRVFISGGISAVGTIRATAELYEPSDEFGGGQFSLILSGAGLPNVLQTPRYGHRATLLADGGLMSNSSVMLSGGFNAAGTPQDTIAIYYDDGVNSNFADENDLSRMATAHVHHTATLLPGGDVLVIGGEDAAGLAGKTLVNGLAPGAERYVIEGNAVGAGAFSVLAADPAGQLELRTQHTASLAQVNDSQSPAATVVVVAGGKGEDSAGADIVLATAQVFFLPNGERCDQGNECRSGHCVKGICCDDGCSGDCFSCRSDLTGHPDGTCAIVTPGTELPPTCDEQVNTTLGCGDSGQVYVALSEVCTPGICNPPVPGEPGSCKPNECVNHNDCSNDGWCDLTKAPEADGAGGVGGAGVGGAGAGGAGAGGAGIGGAGVGGAGVGGAGVGGAGIGGAGVGGAAGMGGAGVGGAGVGGAGVGGAGVGGAAGMGGAGGEEVCLADFGDGGAGGAGGSIGVGGGGGAVELPVGTCVDKLSNGAECCSASQCDSGYCVDGVCCNDACEGVCGFCPPSIGVCTPVPVGDNPNNEDPTDPSCEQGKGTACASLCDGSKIDACVFPGNDQIDGVPVCACGDADAGCGVTKNECAGDGTSNEALTACEGYRCAANGEECAKTCADDSECTAGYICEKNACELLAGSVCDGNYTVRVENGEAVDCRPIRCAKGQGNEPPTDSCMERCRSIEDCIAPAVCNLDGECVEQILPPELKDCSCAVVLGDKQRHEHAAWWLLAGLGVVARRRRRRVSNGRPSKAIE